MDKGVEVNCVTVTALNGVSTTSRRVKHSSRAAKELVAYLKIGNGPFEGRHGDAVDLCPLINGDCHRLGVGALVRVRVRHGGH